MLALQHTYVAIATENFGQQNSGVFALEHDLSKIPAIPAGIRTSPFQKCSLLTIVSKAATSTSRAPSRSIADCLPAGIQPRRERQWKQLDY
jgi:hypothetical protein